MFWGNREIFGTDMLLSGFSSVVIISAIAFFSRKSPDMYMRGCCCPILRSGGAVVYLFIYHDVKLSFPSAGFCNQSRYEFDYRICRRMDRYRIYLADVSP